MAIPKGLATVAGRLRSGRHPQHRTGRNQTFDARALARAYKLEPAPACPKYTKYKGRWVLSNEYRSAHPYARASRREIEALKKENRTRKRSDLIHFGHNHT